MSKDNCYHYSGTKGHIVDVASSLPSNPQQLLDSGWEDVSHPQQAASGSFTFKEKSSGLRVRFDKGVPGANGFRGKDHYHILNPNATGNSDLYLDKEANPVRKNSKKSHILPNGG